jgi:reductive dehalogenase
MRRIKTSPGQYLNQLFSISKNYKRFNQRFDIFNRSMWDDSIDPKAFYVSYDITNYKPKKSEGFKHWDYALRNASWHLTDFIGERNPERVEGFTDYYTLHTQGPPQKMELPAPEECSQRIKRAAAMLGAGMTGICEIDERWIYSHNFSRQTGEAKPFDLPEHLKYAIIIITPMDYELTKTIPSAIGGSSTGIGYTTSLACANGLAQFITNLGYEAVASLNDTALSIPMAIQAGLGEYGRNGLLITPKYGPRVRISKVFTDLPLAIDQPIEFGVKQFCNSCRKCADGCPAKAIDQGKAQDSPPNISSHSGIKKWTVNAEKCFKFWVNMNTDCAICIRVCPYNKDYSKWWNRWAIKLSDSFLRKLLLKLDNWLGYGQRKKPDEWWNLDNLK